MTRLKAYLASAFGCTEAGRHYMRTVCVPALMQVVEVKNPWDVNPYVGQQLEEACAANDTRQIQLLRQGVAFQNFQLIRECDMLVANLDGQEIDAGVACEIGYAHALGIPCHGWRSDFRGSGEKGGVINLQVEFLIRGSVHANLLLLVAYLSNHPGYLPC